MTATGSARWTVFQVMGQILLLFKDSECTFLSTILRRLGLDAKIFARCSTSGTKVRECVEARRSHETCGPLPCEGQSVQDALEDSAEETAGRPAQQAGNRTKKVVEQTGDIQ